MWVLGESQQTTHNECSASSTAVNGDAADALVDPHAASMDATFPCVVEEEAMTAMAVVKASEADCDWIEEEAAAAEETPETTGSAATDGCLVGFGHR